MLRILQTLPTRHLAHILKGLLDLPKYCRAASYRESSEKFTETYCWKSHRHQLAQNFKGSQPLKFMPWRWQALANCVSKNPNP